MKSFVVLAAVLACAAAKPGLVSPLGYSTLGYSGLGYSTLGYTGLGYSAVAAAPALTYAAPAVVAPAFTKTQYHAQDELGQASHGYAYPGQAAAETRDAAGNVRGSYAYVDPTGREVRANYVADALGFRVESNALPVGPAAGPAATLVGPAPVQDTVEVASARAAHLAAVQEARAGRKRRGLAYTYGTHLTTLGAPAVTYAAAPAISYAAAPALTYAAAPAVSYAAAPALTYAAAPAVSYAAVPAVRAATLTKVVNTPGHAVSYRVD
ncbi:unnamed protein product [Allacma fusca]|uniref:Cuticle protein 7 n=1 Tax=Allacma fusca TaxID=39272 RepID=A0A8J2P2V9_9HEXA|nr:unnamed protein product [Allacma fusca]